MSDTIRGDGLFRLDAASATLADDSERLDQQEIALMILHHGTDFSCPALQPDLRVLTH